MENKYEVDIFVIDCWPDNESKENDLIGLIKILKIFNIPILLSGHYPIKPEIQKMVDYYLFDKDNPLLLNEEFKAFDVASHRWTTIGDIRIENDYIYHHDYAIWTTMKNAFNFCKYLGKKNIHFFEYDNLPDPIQYRQAFLERIGNCDAVLYEYHKNSIKDTHLAPYCATFIFSIKTDIGIKVINQVNSKEEYFMNRPKGWQLERVFLEELKKVTNNIQISPYIANNNELNTQAVWNRDGMDRNGAKIQLYLAVDDIDDLYIHPISGFHETPADEDYQIEIVYDEYKKFHLIKKGSMEVHKLGKYQKGYSVKVYYQGVEIFNEFLGDDVERYRKLNSLKNKSMSSEKINHIPSEIKINFIDGAFVEVNDKDEHTYHVQFINKKNNIIDYELDLKNNHWARCDKKYYIDWLIKIKGVDNDYELEYSMDCTGKRVLISFESKALGDTLAWIPYVEKFQNDNNCTVICSTFHNNLFQKQYTHIQFVEPGTNVNNVHALYRIGVFYLNGKIDFYKHPFDPKSEPLTKMASDILGLDYIELKPRLPILTTTKKKMVTIAIHGTAQCKYWNNPTGWQDVVDFLKKNDYEVRLLSKEIDGYMGNIHPHGITKKNAPTPLDALKVLQESELFIGISSGLSWLSWAAGTKTILISGFTDVYTEPMEGITRIINKDVCNSCWNTHAFDPGDWNWCPVHKGTERQFECSKTITSEEVIEKIKIELGL